MATTVNVYVDPDASGANNGTSWANAYTSLQAAESANDVDITAATGNDTIVIFHCKSGSGTADAAAAFSGWTTSSGNYIKVQGGYAAGETGTPGTPGSPVEYGTSFYHVEGTNANLNYVDEDFVIIDKVLCSLTVTGTAYAFATGPSISASNLLIYTNCIAKATCSGTGGAAGFNPGDLSVIARYENCIAYGFISGADSSFGGFRIAASAKIDIYNCLSYNNYYGFRKVYGTVSIYTSVAFSNTDDFSGAPDVISYCASDDNDTTDATNVVANEADATWSTDFADAANGDFTLLAGSPLIGAGLVDPSGSGYGSVSINGITRGAAWDVGPWEFVAAGGVPLPVFMHHYMHN